MALLTIVHQLFIDGVWTTFPAYEEDGWSYKAGPDVDSGARPNEIQLRWQNPNLTMDPSRPDSPLYGKAGRQTQARILLNTLPLGVGEASNWEPDRTIGHTVAPATGLSWVDFTAQGILHRLALWTDPIASAMARQITSYTANGIVGYARLEDPSGVTTLSQEVQGVRPGAYSGSVLLGGNDGPGGSAECLSLGSDGTFTTYFKNTAAAGYQICFSSQLAAVPTTGIGQTVAEWTDTRGRRFVWEANNVSYTFRAFDVDGTALTTAGPIASGVTMNAWIRMGAKVTVAAGTVTVAPFWYKQDDPVIFFIPGGMTFASTTTGQPVKLTSTAVGNTYLVNAAFAHVFAITDTVINLFTLNAPLAAFNGYLSDTPADRFNRLLDERGIARTVLGTSVGPAMGRQKPGPLLELLQECVDTDGGYLYDATTPIPAVVFATRDSLTNRTPALNLNRTALTPPFKRRLDNVGKENVITVNNAAGEKTVARLDTGPMSTQPPPIGIGELKGSVDVNMADASGDLANRGQLELNKGTLDRVRYDSLTLNMVNNTTLQDAVTNMRPGDWIKITGEEADPLVLQAVNWTRTGDAVNDKVTFACLPADLYNVAVIDQADALIDSTSSTLNAGITTTATTFVITTYDPTEVWSQTAAYDLMLAGERIGVPAAGMGAVSGTGPYLQTVTGAVRSKNGIVKAQTATTVVQLADSKRIF